MCVVTQNHQPTRLAFTCITWLVVGEKNEYTREKKDRYSDTQPSNEEANSSSKSDTVKDKQFQERIFTSIIDITIR